MPAVLGWYGVPPVYAELRARGRTCPRRWVAHLARQVGLRGQTRRRDRTTTRRDLSVPPAPDRLKRDFTAAAPNPVWVTDITSIPTFPGRRYLAVILDWSARLVVGWALGERRTTELPLGALNMAFQQRRLPAGRIRHSDRASIQPSRLGGQERMISPGQDWGLLRQRCLRRLFLTTPNRRFKPPA